MAAYKNRLQPIINIAVEQERKAARELVRIVNHQKTIREQIDRLKAYSSEYRLDSLVEMPNNAMFTDRRLFLSRLAQTIQQLQQQYKSIDKKRLSLLFQWEKSKNWMQSLKKYGERQHNIEVLQAIRIEQKEMDEIAGRSESRTKYSLKSRK